MGSCYAAPERLEKVNIVWAGCVIKSKNAAAIYTKSSDLLKIISAIVLMRG